MPLMSYPVLAPRPARDGQARVVAGERPEHAVVLRPVERAGDRGRGPQLTADDDEVLSRYGPPAELGQNRSERVARVAAGRSLRKRIPRLPEWISRLLDPELANVPRDGRLGDATAGPRERRHQLELGADPPAGDDARDQPLPLLFGKRTTALHEWRINIHDRARSAPVDVSARATHGKLGTACCANCSGPGSTPASQRRPGLPHAQSRPGSGAWPPERSPRPNDDQG